ncbi:MAG: IS256 family transposase [Acetobacteraceae bacterium]
MGKGREAAAPVPEAAVAEAWQRVGASFERFCLTTGVSVLSRMMEQDAVELCGPRYGLEDGKAGQRWGKTQDELGFHGGQVALDRPRVRVRHGEEMAFPSWQPAQSEDLPGRWAMNLRLINVSTRQFGRVMRLPGGDILAPLGAGRSKSAVSRQFVALSAAQMTEWMAADLSNLDLLLIRIDGIHIEDDLVLLAAVGIDSDGVKRPLGVLEGATENAAVVQALLGNLVERGLDAKVCRLFIIDGAKALRKAIRRTFGKLTPVQSCQVHKGRNIMQRLPKHLHTSVRKTLCQAWELHDARRAELLIRNPARRLEQMAPGVSTALLERVDELLGVVRLKPPPPLRRSLARTNIIENMMGSIRRVCRNVKRWRDAPMALRWTGAAIQDRAANRIDAKGFRRLKAHKQLPVLRKALAALEEKNASSMTFAPHAVAA